MTVAKKLFTTVPDDLAKRLQERAEEEGRTVSNLLSYLAERGMEEWTPKLKKQPKQDDRQ